ncbi:helix-turn-helix domain-containing protein [Pseudozobellia thermophila]|uniref:helix-turn-helix domain-containing protein n=1 Tax=Pseudozobellia thermophila TaxID=192903 RepID=UPI001FCE0DB7|nr:helix-turn-helix domain-containing protein [Pseudozobellia thermophila]
MSYHISAKRLNQILKEKLDKTGVQLIHNRLMLEAKRQILHSENTIKEIAYNLGFKDHSHFSRFFKLPRANPASVSGQGEGPCDFAPKHPVQLRLFVKNLLSVGYEVEEPSQ